MLRTLNCQQKFQDSPDVSICAINECINIQKIATINNCKLNKQNTKYKLLAFINSLFAPHSLHYCYLHASRLLFAGRFLAIIAAKFTKNVSSQCQWKLVSIVLLMNQLLQVLVQWNVRAKQIYWSIEWASFFMFDKCI